VIATLDRMIDRFVADRPDRRAPRLLLAAAVLTMGQAIAAWSAFDGRPFLPWLAASLLLLCAATVGDRLDPLLSGDSSDRSLRLLLAAGIVVGAITILTSPNALPTPAVDGAVIRWGDARTLVLLAMVVGLSGLMDRPPLGRLHLPVLLGIVLVLGLWAVATNPWPAVDVFFFARDAGIHLGRLVEPYGQTITNIYGSTVYYGEGFATAERVLIGNPYPPVPVLVTSAGQILLNEPRVGLVLAFVAAGGVIASIRRDALGRGAAALFLLTPAFPFLLREAFVDPVAILLLAATVAAARRSPRATALFLGLFLFAKQTCLIALPLIPFLVAGARPRREVLRITVLALATMGIVLLPFLLWDATALLRATVLFHLASPFRPDTLGFGPAIAQTLGSLPTWLTALPVLAMLLVILVRGAWTPAGFAAGTGTLLFVLAAFAKQGFPNYYFLVIGALCTAIAAARPEPVSAREAASPTMTGGGRTP